MRCSYVPPVSDETITTSYVKQSASSYGNTAATLHNKSITIASIDLLRKRFKQMSRVNDSEHLLVKKQTKKTQQVAL